MKYKVPEQYYFRIHHVRPRFKGDVEGVLVYIAEEISRIGERPTEEFKDGLNSAIIRYPGNATKELKTINNWRTEIASLFGFVEQNELMVKPGRRALELAQKQDLVEAFKIFLYNFQYPGAHIKPKETLKQICAGIRFKPAKYILKLLRYANRNGGNSFGITKAEVCHCVFNDLRVTRDNEDVDKTWARIIYNRNSGMTYDTTGDVIRYAGDIIDYMKIADLLTSFDGRTYYLNTLEEEMIIKFTESSEWFSDYDNMLDARSGTIEEVHEISSDWFSYVNRDMGETDFSTDIFAYIADDGSSDLKDAKYLQYPFIDIEEEMESNGTEKSKKDIGDFGENLIYAHEQMRMKLSGREDLVHLVKRIPTQYAVGYDICSSEIADASKRFIEVKTTVSSKPLVFNRVHLTPNEWSMASTTRQNYYVYRLMLSRGSIRLFLLQDPVGLYKNDQVKMNLNDGVDIIFDPKKVGKEEKLLIWKD